MTLEQYQTAMDGRTRPIGSTMSNARASKTRTETAACYESNPDTYRDAALAGRLRPPTIADQTGGAMRVSGPRQPGPAPQPVQCGTNSGYVTHIKRTEPPCDLCTLAHNVYMGDYKRRRKQAATPPTLKGTS